MISRLAWWRTGIAGAVLLYAGLQTQIPPMRADRRLLTERGDAPDIVTVEAQRYLPLVGSLPASGIVGYLQPDDWPSAEAQRRFYLAEYSLTPRLVVLGTDAEYVIGVPEASAKEIPGFDLYGSFDNALRIYRRRP